MYGFVALAIAGVGGVVAFNVIGSTLDDQGLLEEPFYLLGLGSVALLVGLSGATVTGGILAFRARQSPAGHEPSPPASANDESTQN